MFLEGKEYIFTFVQEQRVVTLSAEKARRVQISEFLTSSLSEKCQELNNFEEGWCVKELDGNLLIVEKSEEFYYFFGVRIFFEILSQGQFQSAVDLNFYW